MVVLSLSVLRFCPGGSPRRHRPGKRAAGVELPADRARAVPAHAE
jgi:hypothetical protein